MTAKQAAKRIRTYIDKSIRHIKHRNGFGVHSPFAYNLITEVIEEKCHYYAYPSLCKIYTKDSPVKMKVGMLLFRLANRFKCREFLDLTGDCGYTAAPFAFVDKKSVVTCVTDKVGESNTLKRFKLFKNSWYENRENQLRFICDISCLPDDYSIDMVAANGIPQGFDNSSFLQWLMVHSHPNTVFWIKGIRTKQPMEKMWEMMKEDEQIEVTMDLYDYGLALRKPRFFKQHYIVSF